MTYQLVNMPRFKALIFIKVGLKLSYFLQKMKYLQALEAQLPDPRNSSSPMRILATRLMYVAIKQRI